MARGKKLLMLDNLKTTSSSKKLEFITSILSFLSAIIVTVLATVFREELSQYAQYGYTGIFIACIAANSTVLLPAPSSAIVLAFSNVFSPFGVAVAGGLGAAVGEVVGYMAGFSGKRIVEQTEWGTKVQAWMERNGFLTIFILAFLPLPLFDLVGVLAGATKTKFFKFIFPTVLGKLLKMFIYAYMGVIGLQYIERFLIQ